MRKTLSPELGRGVALLGKQLDLLMFSSERAEMAGVSLRGDISKLNARLVNELIFVGPQLSGQEGAKRLTVLEKETHVIRKRYLSIGIRPDGHPILGDPTRTISLPAARRAVLISDFDQAFELYPKLVDRHVRGAYAELGSLHAVDRDIFQRKPSFDRLAESTEDISRLDGATYAGMLNLLGSAFTADEALKRQEGVSRRAEATVPLSRESAWGTLAIASAGLAAVGMTLKMAVRG